MTHKGKQMWHSVREHALWAKTRKVVGSILTGCRAVFALKKSLIVSVLLEKKITTLKNGLAFYPESLRPPGFKLWRWSHYLSSSPPLLLGPGSFGAHHRNCPSEPEKNRKARAQKVFAQTFLTNWHRARETFRTSLNFFVLRPKLKIRSARFFKFGPSPGSSNPGDPGSIHSKALIFSLLDTYHWKYRTSNSTSMYLLTTCSS